MTDHIVVERMPVNDDGAVLGLVTMNQPDSLNPLDWDSTLELGKAFDALAEDDDVRVVAVTGAGRAFSAGGDMKKYQQLQADPTDFPPVPGGHPRGLRPDLAVPQAVPRPGQRHRRGRRPRAAAVLRPGDRR